MGRIFYPFSAINGLDCATLESWRNGLAGLRVVAPGIRAESAMGAAIRTRVRT